MRAALQFGGHLAELCCKFAQCQPRVDLWGLVREFQALCGVLSAFFRRRHYSVPSWANARPGAIVPLPGVQSARVTLPKSILDNPKRWQERVEADRENVSASAPVTALDQRSGGSDLPAASSIPHA
jgi:hypothetical protein